MHPPDTRIFWYPPRSASSDCRVWTAPGVRTFHAHLPMVARHAHRRKRTRRDTRGDDSGDDDESAEEEKVHVQRDGATIFFHCDVTTDTVLQLIRALDAAAYHAFAHDVDHITLSVHSYGGCAFAGLSAFDHIVSAKVPVHTVATGFVASAATVLCLAGARRFAHRHACLLIHELSTGMSGKLGELVEEVANSKVTMRMLQSVYEERTSLGRPELRRMLQKETMLTFDQAVEYGFVEGSPPARRTPAAFRGPAWRAGAPPPRRSAPRNTPASRLHTVVTAPPPNTHIRWT